MPDIQPDPDANDPSPEAIVRRFTRLSIALGRVEDVMTELAAVNLPPVPPIIPTLSTVIAEAGDIQAVATRLGGMTGRATLVGDDTVGDDPDAGGTTPAQAVRRLSRVARILARIEDRQNTLGGILANLPPVPPIIPVLSTMVDQATSISASATQILNGQAIRLRPLSTESRAWRLDGAPPVAA